MRPDRVIDVLGWLLIILGVIIAFIFSFVFVILGLLVAVVAASLIAGVLLVIFLGRVILREMLTSTELSNHDSERRLH